MTVPAVLPDNETERLAALRRYAILDTESEPCFDRIVELASRQFDVPIALVSLVDQDRQWFKATCGLDASETSRDVAFCAHAILGDDVFLVPDATEDSRFASNPLVTDGLKVRFYAGAPLRTHSNMKLGTLCLIDTKPRDDFDEAQQTLLMGLADVVAELIEMRLIAREAASEVEAGIETKGNLAIATGQIDQFLEYMPVPLAMFDADMRYIAVSRSWHHVFDLDDSSLIGRSYYDVFENTSEEWMAQHKRVLQGESVEVTCDDWQCTAGKCRKLRRLLHPWYKPSGDIGGIIIFNEDVTKRVTTETDLDKSRRFLEAVLENIQDGVVACDSDGNLTYFNRATRRLHGVDHNHDSPEAWADNYEMYERDAKTPLVKERIPLFQALNGKIVDGQEMVIARQSGEVSHLVTNAVPMYSDNGEKVGAVASMHDVTSQRAAERESQNSQLRYRAIIDNTFQFCGLLHEDGTLFDVNKTAVDFSGVSREELIGKPFWDTYWWQVNGETRANVEDAVRRAANGEFVRYEVDVQGKDGALLSIDFSLKSIHFEEDDQTVLIAEGRDISDRKLAEEATRKSEAELQLILDNVPIRIFFKDDKNRILRLNEPAARSLGKTIEELEGQDTYALYPEVARKYHDDDLEVINSGVPKLGIVEPYRPKDGTPGWVRTDKVPYIDPTTGGRYVFVAATNITSEKLAEEALRISEERHRSLYNQTPVMLHSIDQDGRFISVSDFWLATLGYDRDEVIGKQSTDFLTEESARYAVETVLPAFLKLGVCKDISYQIKTKSGKVLDILLAAVAEVDEDGDIIRSMAVLTDVTERKDVERRLVQSQKMESVGQLTGGLAHDFNNILGVVMGNLQLIERSVADDDKLTKRVTSALKAVDRGAELTRRLLAFSRRQKLETSTIEVNPLVDGFSEMLKRTLGEAIEIQYSMGTDLPRIHTDPTQLESAILNLAINARDAMPSGGRVTIETSVVVLDSDYTAREDGLLIGEYVVLSVTDTGSGIPADKLPSIFEPFFTTKDVGKGSGLGLSMIYGFMKQSGGHVRAYSEMGQGTTIRLYLPVDRENTQIMDAEENQSDEHVGMQQLVLVVEDQADVREVAVLLLDDIGYKTIEATDANEALKILDSNLDIAAMFTDIVMPGGMNGTELAKQAHKKRPDLPVIFATGYAEAAVLREGHVQKAENLVTKPYRREDIAKKMSIALPN